MGDPFELERFVAAQDAVYSRVVEELRRGRKTSHWMWFVFPQREGLGQSGMARRYGIGSKAEALAYLDHAILGPRLLECVALVNQVEGRTIEDIFGDIDALKFRSSMTLFEAVAEGSEVFSQAIEKYYAGKRDTLTIEWLNDYGVKAGRIRRD